tara:strand:+ start:117 stop:446 length:330 start_codon:yes stop_codon:yes gene_type:complete
MIHPSTTQPQGDFQMSNYQSEFANYDDVLSIPAGWVDTSWHNDICPSFEKTFGDVTFRLWCDFKNPELREVGGLRFTVCTYLNEDELNESIGQSESLEEALNFVNKETV